MIDTNNLRQKFKRIEIRKLISVSSNSINTTGSAIISLVRKFFENSRVSRSEEEGTFKLQFGEQHFVQHDVTSFRLHLKQRLTMV